MGMDVKRLVTGAPNDPRYLADGERSLAFEDPGSSQNHTSVVLNMKEK